MSETFDPDLWAMRHMAADELDSFTAVLETIEKEQAWFAEFQERVASDPNVIPSEKERADIMAHINRIEGAHRERNEILGKYANQGHRLGRTHRHQSGSYRKFIRRREA
jgi:hypothetical protein